MSCQTEEGYDETLVGVALIFFLLGTKVGWTMGRRDLLRGIEGATRIITQIKEK